jgi:hypothetical protein
MPRTERIEHTNALMYELVMDIIRKLEPSSLANLGGYQYMCAQHCAGCSVGLSLLALTKYYCCHATVSLACMDCIL